MSDLDAQVSQAVFAVLEEFNGTLPPESQIPPKREAPIYGKGSLLDSLGLVNLLILLEAKIGDHFQTNIVLLELQVVTQENNPFATVGSLTDYIAASLRKPAQSPL